MGGSTLTPQRKRQPVIRCLPNYHKFSSSKQCPFVTSQFRRSAVGVQRGSAGRLRAAQGKKQCVIRVVFLSGDLEEELSYKLFKLLSESSFRWLEN